jgi:predicted outer membrane repeat protein
MSRIIVLKNGSCLSAFVLFLYLLILPIPAHTETFNVTNEEELREALSSAGSNGADDVINIAAGIYNTGGQPFTYESDEDFSLTIVGETPGLTILDGSGMSRVLKITTVSTATIIMSIRGLTVQNGLHISTPDDMSISDGAGIYVTSQNISIQDCQFINNNVSRAGLGGGIYASAQSVLMLSGNLFSQNTAAFSGGGIYIEATEITMSDNEFMGNTSELGNGGGAYIYNQNIISPSINNNKFIYKETVAVSQMGTGGGQGISAR